MPTKRPRHTITETGPVAEALERARSVAGSLDLKEIVVLGANAYADSELERQRSDERRAELRRRLLKRTLRPGAVDADAALEVREQGWVREPDE